MADNSTFSTASGNEIFAFDDIGGVKYQRAKLSFGVDGASADVSSANPIPVTLATTSPGVNNDYEYETVAASQTQQILGASGATSDYLAGVLVIPATTSPGNVIIVDNATSITVFTGGTSSVSNLVPFWIELGIRSVSGAWKITTGANVSVIGIGNFT
jgi:hypothetical protein